MNTLVQPNPYAITAITASRNAKAPELVTVEIREGETTLTALTMPTASWLVVSHELAKLGIRSALDAETEPTETGRATARRYMDEVPC